ncbi:MAG: ATPase [Microbacterium arborescens]
MKNALWFVLGVAGGFVAAHVINKDPRGHEMLAEVDARISEFADRIGDAYREQEARIEGLAADVKGAASDALDAAADAASDAADTVADTASDVADAARDTAAKAKSAADDHSN